MMKRDEIAKLQDQCKNLKVLYVEDNDLARVSTTDILNNFFNEITVGYDGVDGLQKFKSKKLDLIITDINMPHMNGLDMVAQIKKIDPEIPILIISAYNESNYFLETIKLGVEGYLLKPIDLEQFMMMLKKTIEKIALKEQNLQYKLKLEQKVQDQVEELMQKDKIITQKSKLAVMGEMVDAIAHQFKQPLSIIQLQAQQLLYAYEDNSIDEEVIKHSTQGTMKQVDHLCETIEQFRDFLRPDTQPEKIKVESLLGSVLMLTQDELKQHAISVELKGDLDCIIEIIPGEFKHVIINLLNNSKDAFIDNNIKNPRQITIEVIESCDKTILNVFDNAGGIPESIIDHIFEPNTSMKKAKTNSGIGLYISQMILIKTGADIKAGNTKEGALFSISLPKEKT